MRAALAIVAQPGAVATGVIGARNTGEVDRQCSHSNAAARISGTQQQRGMVANRAALALHRYDLQRKQLAESRCVERRVRETFEEHRGGDRGQLYGNTPLRRHMDMERKTKIGERKLWGNGRKRFTGGRPIALCGHGGAGSQAGDGDDRPEGGSSAVADEEVGGP
jgi:hypothetical protein